MAFYLFALLNICVASSCLARRPGPHMMPTCRRTTLKIKSPASSRCGSARHPRGSDADAPAASRPVRFNASEDRSRVFYLYFQCHLNVHSRTPPCRSLLSRLHEVSSREDGRVSVARNAKNATGGAVSSDQGVSCQLPGHGTRKCSHGLALLFDPCHIFTSVATM